LRRFGVVRLGNIGQKALATAGINPSDWIPRAGFRRNEPTFSKVYGYYESLHLADNRLKWAAMAKLAGGEVYRGYREKILPALRFGEFLRSSRGDKYTVLDLAGDAYGLYSGTLDIRLLEMQKAIFMDLAWQHQAFREGGIAAIAAAHGRKELSDELFYAWLDIDSGVEGRVNSGNAKLLRSNSSRFSKAVPPERASTVSFSNTGQRSHSGGHVRGSTFADTVRKTISQRSAWRGHNQVRGSMEMVGRRHDPRLREARPTYPPTIGKETTERTGQEGLLNQADGAVYRNAGPVNGSSILIMKTLLNPGFAVTI
jgi:hypothetical protein